jgi:hypothetical protein
LVSKDAEHVELGSIDVVTESVVKTRASSLVERAVAHGYFQERIRMPYSGERAAEREGDQDIVDQVFAIDAEHRVTITMRSAAFGESGVCDSHQLRP